MNQDRATEIATMALHKLAEIDKDMAYRFFYEEIEMDAEEIAFFGMERKRKAVNIEWEEEGLPSEVYIPTDVDTDDIMYYLEETKNGTVVDFEIEEEDEC